MNYMLWYAVNYGTASPARLSNMSVAGKTGTTSDDNDRWFAGYTPTTPPWSGAAMISPRPFISPGIMRTRRPGCGMR